MERQGWIRGDLVETITVQTVDVCNANWTPTNITDGTNSWVPDTMLNARLQELRDAEQAYLSKLGIMTYIREMGKEGVTEAIPRIIEYLSPRLQTVAERLSLLFAVVSVGQNFTSGSLEDARNLYREARIFREELEAYNTPTYRCGHWTSIPIIVWDRSNVTSFDRWWNILSNYLPVDALLTCIDFPDTCSTLF